MKKTIVTILCLFVAIPSYARKITVNADGSGEYLYIDEPSEAIDGRKGNESILENPGYAPNVIIIKFRQSAADSLYSQFQQGAHAVGLQFSDSLQKLNNKYKLKKVSALFKNFRKNQEKLKALLKQDKILLTPKQKHILRRLKRAPKGVKVPELDRIYKIEVELEVDQSIQQVVEAYNDDPDVEYAELNYRVSVHAEPNDPRYPIQWPLNNTGQMYPESGNYNHPPGTPDSDIDAPEAWDIQIGSSEVVVAVIGTGVDYTHRDIDDNMWVNEAEFNGTADIDDDGNGYVDDVYGYDFCSFWGGRRDSDPLDDNGHGTHCAGIIAAEINNGLDIAGICGDAKIMAVKFIDNLGWGIISDAVESLYYAVYNGADILSNSWGYDDYSQAMEEAIAYAHSQGVVVVASAGNNGNTNPHYPAYYDYVISVAATNSNDQRASFSTYGDWVDIAAPGVDILSLRAADTLMGTIYNFYTTITSGTSFAGPHVAGVSALMLSICPEMDVEYLENALFESADPIDSQICASGRLNAYRAIRQMVSRQGAVFLDREVYSCSTVIEMKLLDSDIRGNATQSVTLETGGGDLETVLLSETNTTLGIFAGSISTDSGVPNIEDGILQVSDGEVITVTYLDADDGSGNPAITTDTAMTDCRAPMVFNVEIYGLGPVLTFTFETDEPTTARVLGGTSCGGPYTVEVPVSVLKTNHTIVVTSVSPETDYYFVIEACDGAGNVAIDDDNGQCHLFTTTGPRDIYVPSEHPNIQEAIDIAWDGSTIWVAPGRYTGEGNYDIDFLGKAIEVRSETGPENCIIDCNSERRKGFYFRSGEDASSILIGFTIINSSIGVYCYNSNPTIINCRIIGANFSTGIAYGIYCKQSNPLISNCTINNIQGSGMYNYRSSPTLIECTFSENSYPFPIFPSGGMINVVESSPRVINCTFINNSAIFGGAIYCEMGGSIILTGCTFIANEASQYGGGLLFWQGTDAVIANCAFIGNTAQEGAGLCCYGNSVISNCTFVENTAWKFGGAISFAHDASLVNCILYGNTAPRGAEVVVRGSPTIDINHSNIQGGSTGIYFDWHGTLNWGEGNIDEDPLFAFGTDYHLMSDSPCIDAGTNEPNSTLPETDIDGSPRLLDGDGDGTAIIDMGAHEYNPQGPAIAVSSYAANFTYVPGWSEPSSKTQTLQIRNCGSGTLNWGLAEDCNWLEVVPANGNSAGEIDEVIITVDVSQLTAGNYISELTISDADAVNSPQKVIVTLCIGRILHVPSEYERINEAIPAAVDGDVIIVQPGSYSGSISFYGENITVTSTNPADTETVDETIIDGDIIFFGNENPSCVLNGFRIKGHIKGHNTRATISRCIFRRNKPSVALISDCMGIINNCLIVDNYLPKPKGGPPGPLISGCHGVFRNCTIANHSSYSRMRILEGGITTIENCIIYGDRIELFDGAELNISYSNLKGGLESIVLADPCTCTVNWGPGNSDGDPCFVAPGYRDPNGTPGYPFDDFWVDGDYHLLPDSACINAGDPCHPYDPNETDLDGNPRIIGGRIDMGAYEFNPNTAPVADAGSDKEAYAWLDGIADVNLDGSGSYDEDGDSLTYLWSWEIEPNIYGTNGVNPIIELPVGEHTIELIVNDGLEDSEPNCTTVTVIEPLHSFLRIMPRTINRKSRQRHIMVWMRLPAGISKDDIDENVPLTLYPGDIEASRQFILQNNRGVNTHAFILAFFKKSDLMNAVPEDGQVQLEAVGQLVTGRYFFGQRTIRIINPPRRRGRSPSRR